MSSGNFLENHQLYYFRGCPFCIKVRLVLWWMRLNLTLKNIHDHPEYVRELIDGGGKRQVPCLYIEHDGNKRWLYESSDIVSYLKSYSN
ncbi:MAG: hypothetical protein GXP21_07715 [Gammaproteobacteria bacterium]|nr:hypothetical protein [Gammaproteobacteria bacterium]